ELAWPIFEHLHSSVLDGFYLVSNTAFPRGPQSIKGRIRAPLKRGEHIPADIAEQEHLLSFNCQLFSF
ncbi:hypothetical protein C8R41DRAFT_761715, partial [Lentinula lateritia]